MDAIVAAEARERLKKWIEETRQILGLVPQLLDSEGAATERADASTREVERLKVVIEDITKENEQLRGEKEEIAQAMGQIAQKLGFASRRSPFERTLQAGAESGRPGEMPDPSGA